MATGDIHDISATHTDIVPCPSDDNLASCDLNENEDVDLISCQSNSTVDTLNSIPEFGSVRSHMPSYPNEGCINSTPSFESTRSNFISHCPNLNANEDVIENNPLGISTERINGPDVVGAFVVAFDSREGNILEWFTPNSLNMDGIEFRAMMCGAHTITSDFLYFELNNYYGVACYKRISVVSDVERGARMKSVGILSTSYEGLHKHLYFLFKEVDSQVELPGDYSRLKEYYQDNMATIPSCNDPLRNRITLQPNYHNEPTLTMGQLVKFYNIQIMMLWRAVLLKKRILLFTPPPIGPGCQRVEKIAQLGTLFGQNRLLVRPLFYVSLATLDQLENEFSYIACSTNRIFEEKTHLFDVYIDNQTVKSNRSLRPFLHVTPTDKKLFYNLESMAYSQNQSHKILDHFQQRNTNIMSILQRVSNSTNNVITSQHIREMGLNPFFDHYFVKEVARVHGFDVSVTFSSSTVCCLCCSDFEWCTKLFNR